MEINTNVKNCWFLKAQMSGVSQYNHG